MRALTPGVPVTEPAPAHRELRHVLSSNLCITAGAVALIIIHLLWPHMTVDTITLGLVIIAALPWIATIIKSAELPGGWKLEFWEVKRKMEQQRQDIAYLQFVFANFLTEWEIMHLQNLIAPEPFRYTKSASFDQEMRRLRALRFIESIDGTTGIRSMNADPRGDVKNHFRITQRGKLFLDLYTALPMLEATSASAE